MMSRRRSLKREKEGVFVETAALREQQLWQFRVRSSYNFRRIRGPVCVRVCLDAVPIQKIDDFRCTRHAHAAAADRHTETHTSKPSEKAPNPTLDLPTRKLQHSKAQRNATQQHSSTAHQQRSCMTHRAGTCYGRFDKRQEFELGPMLSLWLA